MLIFRELLDLFGGYRVLSLLRQAVVSASVLLSNNSNVFIDFKSC